MRTLRTIRTTLITLLGKRGAQASLFPILISELSPGPLRFATDRSLDNGVHERGAPVSMVYPGYNRVYMVGIPGCTKVGIPRVYHGGYTTGVS